MTKKIIVAKSTFNALTETNPDNLKFSSDYNTLKYYLDGSLSIKIVGNGSDQTSEISVAHNLGYVPFFIAFVNNFTVNDTDYGNVPFLYNFLVVHHEAHVFATSTHLYFKMRNHSNNTYTAYFYYKIFKNNLNLS